MSDRANQAMPKYAVNQQVMVGGDQSYVLRINEDGTYGVRSLQGHWMRLVVSESEISSYLEGAQAAALTPPEPPALAREPDVSFQQAAAFVPEIAVEAAVRTGLRSAEAEAVPDSEASSDNPAGFDYNLLSEADRFAVRAATREIRDDMTSAIESAIRMGKKLAEVQGVLASYTGGTFGRWLYLEFGWSSTTAYNFIRLHRLSDNFPTVGKLDVGQKVLYLLAQSSTPPEAVEDIIQRVEGGEHITFSDARGVVAGYTNGNGNGNENGASVEPAVVPEPPSNANLFAPNANLFAQVLIQIEAYGARYEHLAQELRDGGAERNSGDFKRLLGLVTALESCESAVREAMLKANVRDLALIRLINEAMGQGSETAQEVLITGVLQGADWSVMLSKASARDYRRLSDEAYREHQAAARAAHQGEAVSVLVFEKDAYSTLQALKRVLGYTTLIRLAHLISEM